MITAQALIPALFFLYINFCIKILPKQIVDLTYLLRQYCIGRYFISCSLQQ